MVEKLLKVRTDVKKRKPNYSRQQTNQFAKFKKSDSWRRPKGHQSKVRLRRKNHKRMPEVGYGSPKAIRGLNREGFSEVIVYNTSDLSKVEKGSIAVIGSKVGGKKRLDILAKAKELKMNFANVKDIDAKIEELTKAPKKKESAKKPEAKKADAKKDSSKEETSKEESKK